MVLQNKNFIHTLFLFFIFTAVSLAGTYHSPTVIETDSEQARLYIADYTSKQLSVFDLVKKIVITEIALSHSPTGLALSPDTRYAYLTLASSPGTLQIIDLKNNKIGAEIPVGHGATAPVLNPKSDILYICNQFSNSVSVINLKSKKELIEIPLPREPAAAAITSDGNWLLVNNSLPAGPANEGYVGAAVSVIDAVSNKLYCNIQLPDGSTGVKGIAISADNAYAYVVHILARYQMPTTQLERGWMNTNAMSIIDINSKSLVNTVLLDEIDLGAANPWDVACTQDGKFICVTHAGSHEVSIIDREALHNKLREAQNGLKIADKIISAQDVPNDLAFLDEIRKRVNLLGKGPRGIAISGLRIFVAEYFSESIGIVDIDNQTEPEVASYSLGESHALSDIRWGELFFHDASLCFQQWQSCSSCHPGDGRADALNWDLLNDGMGNPKNTKSLLLAHQTPPAMITGVREKVESAVRAGIKYIQFAERPDEDAAKIDSYLRSLQPLPSPYLVDKKISPKALRGREIYNKAECNSCHPAPLYTDLKQYNVGTGKYREINAEFDTPTLIETWRTAPYLYDGRAASLREVFSLYNKNDRHGKTSKLEKEELEALIEFVLSL